jgi:hypothetical protein
MRVSQRAGLGGEGFSDRLAKGTFLPWLPRERGPIQENELTPQSGG